MNRSRASEADVEGVPVLKLRDEDREALAELLAEALIEALERDEAAERRPAP